MTTAQFFAAATAPPEPAPLAVFVSSPVQDEDNSNDLPNGIPAFNSASPVPQLYDEQTDSRARKEKSYAPDSQVSSVLGASLEPVFATNSADLFDAQPELLDEVQDFELDEIFEGLPR